MFLKNKNIIFKKIRRSKVTDYAALRFQYDKGEYQLTYTNELMIFNTHVHVLMKSFAGVYSNMLVEFQARSKIANYNNGSVTVILKNVLLGFRNPFS